jgi:hypothetical protein
LAKKETDVVFIHHHPGEVKTEIFRHGWDGKGRDGEVNVNVPEKRGVSLEMSGERSLFLISSSLFGGRGVGFGDGEGGKTVEGTDRGALFLVGEGMGLESLGRGVRVRWFGRRRWKCSGLIFEEESVGVITYLHHLSQ